MTRKDFWLHKLISAIVLVVILSTIAPNITRAENGNDTPSWTDSQPYVVSSESVDDMSFGLCSNVNQIVEIVGYSDLKKVCTTYGQTIRFGTYYGNYTYRAAIGFKFDTKMYKLNGICTQDNDCIYLPNSDTLVTKQHLINAMVRSLVVYKNFSQRLLPILKTGVTPSLEYEFDQTNPDYIFQNSSQYQWPVGGYGASSNGKWLAIEFRQRGIGLLNLETLQMKRISTWSFLYGIGREPKSELTVSNDGKHIAVAGSNAGFDVFDIDDNCGDEPTDIRMGDVLPIEYSCKNANINTEPFIHQFIDATQPKFDDNGSELSFYAISYTDKAHYVILRASNFVPPRLDYLAMGDSFTSGEGETDDNYYLNGTNTEYEKCHVSTRSYPFVVARLSNISPNFVKSVACSGATMEDIVGDDRLYKGQGDRLGNGKSGLSYADTVIAKNQAKISFTPGRTHQEIFATNYKPAVITIGIGGNDADFMGKLKTCYSIGTCEWASAIEKRYQTMTEIKNLFGKLVATYKKIHDDSSNSRIYAIGYPKIIDQNGTCDLATATMLNSTEREFMVESIHYLNSVIESAAKSAGIGYIDIENSYGSQVICGDSIPLAANALYGGDDFNPINDSRSFRIFGNESFHPNPTGHQLAATAIVNKYNISTGAYCSNNLVYCPDSDIVAPDPQIESAEYWGVGEVHNSQKQQQTDLIIDDQENLLNRHVSLPPNSLSPSSSVNITLHSDPISLGDFQASSDGSLNVEISLPTDTEEGYHTIHVYGTSYSGESVDLYQTIQYLKYKYLVSVKTSQTISAGLATISQPDNSSQNNPTTTKTTTSAGPVTQPSTTPNSQEVKGVSTEGTNGSLTQINNNQDIAPIILITAFVSIITLVGLYYRKRVNSN